MPVLPAPPLGARIAVDVTCPHNNCGTPLTVELERRDGEAPVVTRPARCASCGGGLDARAPWPAAALAAAWDAEWRHHLLVAE